MKATRIVAILLALYAVYNIWIVVTLSMPLFLLWVVACVVAAIGAWRERPWSRWLVLLVVGLTIVGILANILLLAMHGWPLAWPGESLKALVPAGVAIAVCAWMGVIAWKRLQPV